MDAVEVIAVIGACAPERAGLARRWAAHAGRMLVSASRLASYPDPIEASIALASHPAISGGVVIEFPSDVSATDLIGALGDRDAPTRLMSVACVVDAAHLLADLGRDDYVSRPSAGHPGHTEHTARALVTVTQIEFASTIVLVNWTSLSTPHLSTIMALVCHLNPRARLRLDQAMGSSLPLLHAHGPTQDGAGWIRMLNGSFDPHMTDPRVSALRYEQARPFHPVRLQQLLDGRVERGEFGTIVRSSGFCRFATRPGVTAQWNHVGRMIAFSPVARDSDHDDDTELLAVGQDLVIIGLDLNHDALVAGFDEAVLTDAELLDGPEAWRDYADPFPAWETSDQHAGDDDQS